MKPSAPDDYRGPFQPIATSAPGIRLSEHLPLLAAQAHHLALVNSVGATVNTNDHHAGYYYNLTGHIQPDTVPRGLAIHGIGRFLAPSAAQGTAECHHIAS
jgi:hypothetical protein